MQSYKASQYFEFGKNLGEAVSEVFFKNTNNLPVKKNNDEKAYDFLNGFFSGIRNLTFDKQALYNNIDGKGSMVWGPIQKVFSTLANNNSTLTKAVWV